MLRLGLSRNQEWIPGQSVCADPGQSFKREHDSDKSELLGRGTRGAVYFYNACVELLDEADLTQGTWGASGSLAHGF